MSRYARLFSALKYRGDGALGAFVMLGDPDIPTSARLLDALVEGGADMIEAGIPFSDPIADGPVIQAAANRALSKGTKPVDCFRLIAQFRQRHRDVPVGILTYANLAMAAGPQRFYSSAAKAGADSMLLADVPAAEGRAFVNAAAEAGIDPVFIAASNTPRPTLRKIAAMSKGYTYIVSRAGVTGTRPELVLEHRELIQQLRDDGAPPPVFGFGISRPEHVRAALREGAAGVIVGSAIIRLIEANRRNPCGAVRRFVAELKRATLSTEGETSAILEQERASVRR